MNDPGQGLWGFFKSEVADTARLAWQDARDRTALVYRAEGYRFGIGHAHHVIGGRILDLKAKLKAGTLTKGEQVVLSELEAMREELDRLGEEFWSGMDVRWETPWPLVRATVIQRDPEEPGR